MRVEFDGGYWCVIECYMGKERVLRRGLYEYHMREVVLPEELEKFAERRRVANVCVKMVEALNKYEDERNSE